MYRALLPETGREQSGHLWNNGDRRAQRSEPHFSCVETVNFHCPLYGSQTEQGGHQ